MLDISVDMNTYIKLLSTLYSDSAAKERSHYIQNLMNLFNIEHSSETFALGNELLKEFLWQNTLPEDVVKPSKK